MAVVVVIGIIIAIVSGPGSNPSSMSLSEFKDTLRKISFFPESAGQLIISKQRLIDTFGDPERVTQDPSGDMRIYYQIADGMVEIESVWYYWNGDERWTYVEGEPPSHPIDIRLQSEVPENQWGELDTNSKTYADILSAWYLANHDNPYEIVGPVSEGQSAPTLPGRYYITEDGKHIGYRDDIGTGHRDRSRLEAWIRQRLVGHAQEQLQRERQSIVDNYKANNTKTINEPCFPVLSMRVF